MLELDVDIGYTCVRAAMCEENSVCRSLNRSQLKHIVHVAHSHRGWACSPRASRFLSLADPFGPQLVSLRSDAAVGVVTARVYDG